MIRALLRRFIRREDGTATIEFLIMFPLILMVFMSTFEAAIITTRQAMLERGLDLTVRALRLSTGVNPTHGDVRDMICNLTHIIPNCMDVLLVEVTPVVEPTFNLPNSSAPCVDRSSDQVPLVTLNHGSANQLMLIRACAVVDPFFPMTGLGLSLTKDASGGLQMITVSGYVAEP